MSVNRLRHKPRLAANNNELLYPLGHGSVVEGNIYAFREGKYEGKWRPCVLICTFSHQTHPGWWVLGLTTKALYAQSGLPRPSVQWYSTTGPRQSFIYSHSLVPLAFKDIGAHIGEIGESEPEHIAQEIGFPLFAAYCRDLREANPQVGPVIKSH